MTIIAVTSSAIAGIEYDEKKKTLDVVFTDSHARRYKNVPNIVVNEFLSSVSKGQFFNRNIRDAFDNELIDKGRSL